MNVLELTDRELTFLKLGLQYFEQNLFAKMKASEGEDLEGGELEDLLMVQWLQKKLRTTSQQDAGVGADENGTAPQ